MTVTRTFEGQNGGQGYRPATIILSDRMNRDMDQIVVDLNNIISDLNSIPMNHFTDSTNVHGIGASSAVVGTNTNQRLNYKSLYVQPSNAASSLYCRIDGLTDNNIQNGQNINPNKINLQQININNLDPSGIENFRSEMQPHTRRMTSNDTLAQLDLKDIRIVVTGGTTLTLPTPQQIYSQRGDSLASQRVYVINRTNNPVTVNGFTGGLNGDTNKTSDVVLPKRGNLYLTGYDSLASPLTTQAYLWSSTVLQNIQQATNNFETDTSSSVIRNMQATPQGVIDDIRQYLYHGCTQQSSAWNSNVGVFQTVTVRRPSDNAIVFTSQLTIANNAITQQTLTFRSLTGTQTGNPLQTQVLKTVTQPLTVNNSLVPETRYIY